MSQTTTMCHCIILVIILLFTTIIHRISTNGSQVAEIDRVVRVEAGPGGLQNNHVQTRGSDSVGDCVVCNCII